MDFTLLLKNKLRIYLLIPLLGMTFGCIRNPADTAVKPSLKVSENNRYLVSSAGEPFFWMGGTCWGMSEWLTREDVEFYLDDRAEKEFNLVQVCLFWGKREEDPVRFTTNPVNAYGHKAFVEKNGQADPGQPWVVRGGSPENPNDYWDHVDYILQTAADRNLIMAVLPVWGRRYVNDTHPPYSEPVFSSSAMRSYGEFLGERYKTFPNIIWVLGGDVQADAGGSYLDHYRAMAEGIIKGITGQLVRWNEESPLWDQALMTYHPDGSPMKNSSRWFHSDPWLDFNMIETHRSRAKVYAAVQQDYVLADPVKPTVQGEPDYEGSRPNMVTAGVHIRRQAVHSYFAGAAGFTYGGKIDQHGNGPLWSPYNNWKEMLDMEGARSMTHIKSFCLEHSWPDWTPIHDLIVSNEGEGELQKVAVKAASGTCMVYFPDNNPAELDLTDHFEGAGEIHTRWFNPASGLYEGENQTISGKSNINVIPPDLCQDAILILRMN